MTVNNIPVNVDYYFRRENAETIIAEGEMFMLGEFEVMGLTMNADMVQYQKTEFKLDGKSGLPTSMVTSQEMGGSLIVKGSSTTADVEVPMNMETTVKVTIKLSNNPLITSSKLYLI